MYAARVWAVKLCENESEVGTIFPHWSGRLPHDDRGLFDFRGRYGRVWPQGSKPWPWPNSCSQAELESLSLLLWVWWSSNRRKTSAPGLLQRGRSTAKLTGPPKRSGDWSSAHTLFTPHPPPPLSPSPAKGGFNPCSVLWDGRSSLPTALHFIHHWMLTHKAGGTMVTAAFTRLFPQSWRLYISNMQPL